MCSRRLVLPAACCLALIGAFALGSLPAAASNKQTAQPQGKAAIAQCRKAVTGHATMTTKTVSDCSWLPPPLSIDRGPGSWSVAVIKVGSSSIAVRPGSPPMRLSPGYTAARSHGGVRALLNVCSTRPGFVGLATQVRRLRSMQNKQPSFHGRIRSAASWLHARLVPQT